MRPPPPVKRTLTVAKKPLVVSVVAATRAFGDPNPDVCSFRISRVSLMVTKQTVLANSPTGFVRASKQSGPGKHLRSPAGQTIITPSFSRAPQDLSPVTGLGGSYEAQLVDGNQHSVGKLELTVSNNSLTYSGRLFLSSETKPLTPDRFINSGQRSSVPPPAPSIPAGLLAPLPRPRVCSSAEGVLFSYDRLTRGRSPPSGTILQTSTAAPASITPRQPPLPDRHSFRHFRPAWRLRCNGHSRHPQWLRVRLRLHRPQYRHHDPRRQTRRRYTPVRCSKTQPQWCLPPLGDAVRQSLQ